MASVGVADRDTVAYNILVYRSVSPGKNLGRKDGVRTRPGVIQFGLTKSEIEDVVERIESPSSPNPENAAYLRTKKLRMGHLIGDIE